MAHTNQHQNSWIWNSIYNLINRPTRNTHTSATLIDNIFTNDINMNNGKISGVLTRAITDHYPIFRIIKTDKSLNEEEFIWTRKYNNENREKFISSIRAVNWDDLIPTVDALNAFSVFFNKLRNEYCKAFPWSKLKRNIITGNPGLRRL